MKRTSSQQENKIYGMRYSPCYEFFDCLVDCWNVIIKNICSIFVAFTATNTILQIRVCYIIKLNFQKMPILKISGSAKSDRLGMLVGADKGKQ